MLNPDSDKLAEYIKGLEKRLYNLETTKQYYAGDWNILPVQELSYNANNVLNTTRDLRTILNKGTKIRINQGGLKYFYVVGITASTITLNAGTDFVFTNASFTEFSFSKGTGAVGHPIQFNFNANIRALTGTLTVSGYVVSTFSISENIVEMNLEFNDFRFSTPSPGLGDFPIPTAVPIFQNGNASISFSGPSFSSLLKISTTTSFEFYRDDNFGAFPAAGAPNIAYYNIRYIV